MKRSLILGGLALAVVVGGWYGVQSLLATTSDIPTGKVRKGEFILSTKANGVVDARQAFVLSTPRIRSLQLTWLAAEGSFVNAGDPVIRFDQTQVQNDLNDNSSALKIAQTTLARQRQELTIQKKNLTLQLQQAKRNYDEKKHDAPKLAEEARLELELAELNIKARLDQIRSDVQKAELEVQRAHDKVAASERELEQLTINAPIPGMVVYLEIWKGGSLSKVQAGDSPWPGQGLINLPDLSEMIVKATVSEVDAATVDSGQEVVVRLDAIPDTTFSGKVLKKSTLARKKEPNSKINVFDVEIAIAEKDERLKPGMSASATIVLDRLPSVISVPLEAVFEKEGKPVVYLANRKAQEIEVGRRNDMQIEVTSGLTGEERICLVNPTVESGTLPGDRASEPELNRGRQAGASSGESGQRRVRRTN